MAQDYSTDWDIESYYDGTELEEYWNLRKHFMEVHKGKFPEDYLVALSQAVTNIEFLASINPAPLLATVKRTNQSKMSGDDGSKDNKPNISTLKLHEADNPWKPTDKIDSATAEKLAPVKNEVNAKSSKENVETSNVMEQPPNLPYKKDQWSPSNPDGKKVYDEDFLLALRNDPKSNMKPDIHSDIYRAICKKLNSGVRTEPAMGKSSSQHQPPPKRNSQSKMGGTHRKRNESNVLVSTLELHEAENTRKPTDKIDNATVLSAKKLAQINKNEVNSNGSKENVTHQIASTVLTQEYPTDWDIDSYYDITEPEEYWNLRKHFMEVHKGKFPEDYLVALSKAVTNIEYLASIYPAPLLLPTAKRGGNEGNKPNMSVRKDVKLHEAEKVPTPLKQYFNGGAPGRESGFMQPTPPSLMPAVQIPYTPYPPFQSHQLQPFDYPQIGLQRAGPTPQVPQQNPTQLPPPTLPLMQNTQQHPPQRQQRRRQHALKIIDPATGQDYLS